MSFKVADAFVEITAKDNVDAGKRAAEAKLGAIRDKKVQIDADINAASVRIKQIESKLDTLSKKKASPKVDLEIAAANARIGQIQARMAALGGRKTKLDVDASKVTAGLNQVDSSAKRAESSVSKLGSIRLPDISGRLLLGLAAIPAAAGAAAATIAAIPSLGASLGLGVGVLTGSFSGIGDALKGFQADQDKIASGSGNSAANAARSSARAIRDATQQINDARRDQARTARDSAQQIEDAERGVQDAARGVARAQQGVADAVRDAARTARDSAQQVKDAEESVVEAQEAAARAARDNARAVEQAKQAVADAERNAARAAESAADQVASAERRVADAQRAARQAQQGLNAAREQAVRDLQDLQEKASDAARDEKGAVLDLAEARLRLDKVNNDALSTDLDKAKAAYDVEVAEDRVKDAQKAAADAAKENTQAQAKGVEGADKVVDAKTKLQDATQAATDAQHTLQEALQAAADSAADSAERIANAQESLVEAQERAAESQIDANRRVQDAVENLSQARTREAEANADAQERVVNAQQGVQDAVRAQEDAERQLARTKQHAADQAADAAERVANAEQGLKDAQEDANAATLAGAAAASKFEQAMAKLSPRQQELVRELLRWQNIMRELGRTASDSFLPGFIQMLRDAEGLQGIFNSALERTGTIMGDTARKMGELFKSEDFQKNLDALLKAADPITRSIGNLFVDMTRRVVQFGAEMAPAAAGFAKFIDGMNTGLQGFFDELVPHAASFKSIWESLGRIMDSLLPIVGRLVGALADTFAPILESIAGWLQRNEESIKTWMERIAAATPYILGLVAAVKGLSVLANVVGWVSGAVNAVRSFTTTATEATTSGNAFASVGSRIAGAMPAATAAMAAVAVQAGVFQAGVDKATSALMAGGQAQRDYEAGADSLGERLGKNLLAFVSFGTAADVTQPLEASRRKVDELRAAMTPLELAQADAARAANEHAYAVKQFGADSPQATAASDALAAATDRVEQEQRQAADATKSHTDRMVEQTDAAAAAANSDVAYQQGLLRLEEAQRRATQAAKEHGAGSRELRQANLDVMQANLQVADAARRKAEADAEATGATDAAAIGAQAYKEELQRLAGQATGPTRDALLRLANSTDTAKDSAQTAELRSKLYKDELGRLASQANGALADALGRARQNFDTLGGAHATAEQKALAQKQELQRLANMASGPVKQSLQQMADQIRATPSASFDITGVGKVSYGSPELLRAAHGGHTGGIIGMGRRGLSGIARFASGGVMPGYTPGRDVHTFRSPTGGTLHLSGGEAIMRPEWTQAIGAQNVHRMNAAARVGGVSGVRRALGFAAGGTVDGLPRQSFANGGINMALTGRQPFKQIPSDLWDTVAGSLVGTITSSMNSAIKRLAAMAASAIGGGVAPAGSGPVVAQVQSVANRYGWGSGSQWAALSWLISHESGWRPTAQNPTSTAYGLFQFLNSTWGTVGGAKTSNPAQQAEYGLRYIKQRYGSPLGAQAFWQRNHWYDEGGIASGVGMLPKYTPKPERVLSPRQTDSFERLVATLDARPNVATGGDGVTIQELHVHVNGVLDFRQRDVATRQVVTDLITAIDAVKRSNS